MKDKDRYSVEQSIYIHDDMISIIDNEKTDNSGDPICINVPSYDIPDLIDKLKEAYKPYLEKELKCKAACALCAYFESYIKYKLKREEYLQDKVDAADKFYEKAKKNKQKNEEERWIQYKTALDNLNFFRENTKVTYLKILNEIKYPNLKTITINIIIKDFGNSKVAYGYIDIPFSEDNTVARLSKRELRFYKANNLPEIHENDMVKIAKLSGQNITTKKPSSWKNEIIP